MFDYYAVLRVASVVFLTLHVASCAAMFVVDDPQCPEDPKTGPSKCDELPTVDLKEPNWEQALAYSRFVKHDIEKKSGRVFNTGQGIAGALIGLGAASTAVFGFGGSKDAAAALALGAGTVAVGDRFLLVDESLGMYSSAQSALACGERALWPFGQEKITRQLRSSSEVLKQLFGAEQVPAMLRGGMGLSESLSDLWSASGVRELSDADMRILFVASEGTIAAARAFVDARDGFLALTDAAPRRLIKFVDDVRFAANAALLRKRMDPDSVTNAFNALKDQIGKLRQKKNDADAKLAMAQMAKTVTTDALLAAGATKGLASTKAHMVTLYVGGVLAALAQENALTGSKLPPEEDLEKCLAEIPKSSAQ